MNRLAEILLKKSLNECSVEELQQLIKKYPYWNAGHLLAVQKLHAEGSAQLDQSLQKASLHFQPLHINQSLTGKGNSQINPAPPNMPTTESVQLPTDKPEEINNELAASYPGKIPETGNELKEKTIADLPTEDLVPHGFITSNLSSEQVSNMHQPVSFAEQDESNIEPSQNAEQLVASPEKQDSEFDNKQSSHNDEIVLSREQPEAVPPAVEDTSNANIEQTQNIKEHRDTRNEPPETNTQQLSFEPYHTVDYFASQGIKVKLDENPTDKFSRQLKSFTEWLKTLKKLPDSENIAPANASAEKKVDQLAETSLTDSNVITEAMAAVWAKQGNHQKAIEIYHKLSLLEPTKSAYFASLIEDLKKTSL